MTTPDEFSELAAPVSPPRRASTAWRVLAALAGLAAVLAASIFTLGGAAVAVLGMFVAYAVEQRRGRQLTRRSSWFAAVGAVGVVLVIIAGVTMYKLPAGAVASVKQNLDSATAVAEKQPPPDWLERVAPGSAARSRQQPLKSYPRLQTGVQIWTLAMGGFLVWAITTLFVGTVGWLCGLPVVFAAAGRWIPRSNAVPDALVRPSMA